MTQQSHYWHIPWENPSSERHGCPSAQCSTAHGGPATEAATEAAGMPGHRRTDKEAVAHICNGIPLSHKSQKNGISLSHKSQKNGIPLSHKSQKNGIPLSHKSQKKWDTTQSQITKKWNTTQSQKECLWASCSEVDEPRAPYQSEMREKPISYINTYTWNLENGTDEPICRAGIETQT